MGEARISVLHYDTTPSETVPGAGSIRRIITRQETGMDLTFSKGTIAPGMGHHWHSHENQDEAVFVLNGHGTMHIEGREDVQYGPGTCIVIPRGTRHYNENTSDSDVELVSMFNPALR